jgi:hypothetical protein
MHWQKGQSRKRVRTHDESWCELQKEGVQGKNYKGRMLLEDTPVLEHASQKSIPLLRRVDTAEARSDLTSGSSGSSVGWGTRTTPCLEVFMDEEGPSWEGLT